MVDTVNRDGTSRARITPEQLVQLQAQLDAAGDRWVVVFSHNPLTEEALQILDRHPRVVASIAGNSHKNRITRARPLLADQHLQPRRLPPAVAHVPAP